MARKAAQNDEILNEVQDKEISVQDIEVTAQEKETPNVEPSKTKADRKVKKDIPLNTMVACKNGTRGKLIYVSKKQNGYEVTWEQFGDEEYIELSELVSMRNTARDFFKKNWILIEDDDVLDFLGVKTFYENALTVDDFDRLFDESPDVICEKVTNMSIGLKQNIGMRAKELIDSGVLDSRKRIEALEKSLGWNLTKGV